MYAELHNHTPYSFLDGASSIDELVRRAGEIGMPALAMTDHNSVTAALKFAECCGAYGVRPVFGAEVTMEDASHLTLLAKSRQGYGNICRMISMAYTQGGRTSPSLSWDALQGMAEGIVCLSGCRKGRLSRLVAAHRFDEALVFARELQGWFGRDFSIELQNDFTPHSGVVAQHLAQLAKRIGAECVATNNVHYATRDGFIAHDIKRCIAAGITVANVHPSRPLNSERYLKSAREMAEAFAWNPAAVANSMRIADECAGEDVLPVGEEVTPRYPLPVGVSSAVHLRELVEGGAKRRHGRISTACQMRIDEELHLLNTLGYADFVLHAARIVRWARSQGIHVTGRGSGADSEVCYCLGLTDIDVLERNLPVARWVAPGKKPDIDIDFEARYRDDVFRWVAKTYGADKVALCCTYATYWAKGAVRDIGKALALPSDALAWFTKHLSGHTTSSEIADAFTRLPELRAHAAYAERFALLFDLCARISGHPRHLGSHSSGLVISGTPLDQLNVVTPSARGVLPIIMLDKDDVEDAGAVKLDILSLPILSVVKDASTDIRRNDPNFEYESIPREDKGVYQMLAAGDNMGLFQLGSPAQAALATKLHPSDFEDLVASIGLIRPGPIKAKAVQKYVAARRGWSDIMYLHPALIPILSRTYGVVCFQEQVSYIIAAMLGISDGDSEVWRKRLGKHARAGTMDALRDEFVARACATHRNLPPRNAHQIFDELEGWSGLGFVEGHSASFALTGQKTAHLLRYHPAEYYASLLSNQPCGFFPPQSLASEARRRGIAIKPVDINASERACTTDNDNGDSIRLGLVMVAALRPPDIDAILAAREAREFHSLLDFCARVTISRDSIENLILSGAFDLLHEHRRGLLWRLDETLAKARALKSEAENRGKRLDIRFAGDYETPIAWDIADLTEWDKLMWEWRTTGITSNCHPFAHLRERLTPRGILSAHDAMQQRPGTRVQVAGLNICPHRPPSKSGGRHLFLTLEDESAYMQVSFHPEAIEHSLGPVLMSPVVIITGTIHRRGVASYLFADAAQPLPMAREALQSTAEMLIDPPRRPAAAR